jgi:tRNA (guanine-N7-)-methyltransferase
MTAPNSLPPIPGHLGLFDGAEELTRSVWLSGRDCQRVEVEIGPGDCGFILASAQATPSTLWAGLERRGSSLGQARRVHEIPANLQLVDTDGRWVVEHLIASKTVDAYHVYFPDPWWKKRHHKRRLFRPEFCEAAHRTLVPDGCVYVMTDVTPRFEEIRAELLLANFEEKPWSRLDQADGGECQSSYERKYRRQKRSFHEACFLKR